MLLSLLSQLLLPLPLSMRRNARDIPLLQTVDCPLLTSTLESIAFDIQDGHPRHLHSQWR